MTESAPLDPKSTPAKSNVFHPLLVGIYPVLVLYSANLTLIPVQTLAVPLLACGALALIVWGLMYLLIRDREKSAMGASALLVCFFCYSKIADLQKTQFVPPEWRPYGWIIITLVATFVLVKWWKWHRPINLLAIFLVVVACVQIGFGLFSASKVTVHALDETKPGAKLPASRPDIIYIILDGYGRSDSLKRAMGFDNSDFIAGLEKRGFVVAKDSHSNYCQTELSVASTLNMQFIPELLPQVRETTPDRAPLDKVINHNQVANYLKGLGYTFGAITTEFPPLEFPAADVNYRTKRGLSLIESAVIQETPLVLYSKTITSMFEEKRTNLLSAFEAIESLGAKSASPRFVVVHMLSPHPPFVVDENGNPAEHHGVYGFWDGSDFIDHVGGPQEYQKGYIGQAKYTGKRLLQALDVLLKGSGERPVILVQGDHGSKLRLDQATLDRTDVNECFPNLCAVLAPDSVQRNWYPGMTPVNSFRTILNGLFSADLARKPDSAWYSNFPLPYKFTDVTSRLADHEKMPSVPVPDFGPRPKS